ncbi:MAG: ATP-binding protein [Actinomycetota bacterium]
MLCSSCGAELSVGARFCSQCGAPVSALTTQDRRVVTVVFIDLVSSTRIASELDPERFRELIASFYLAITQELQALGGRAEKFSGDAVMAVFGVPHAHEDDARRAVRAAFRIRDRIASLGETIGRPLQVRIGINTGPVAAGGGPADQFLISGTPVNVAARLEPAAKPNEILIGVATHALVASHVRCGEMRKLEAKGIDGPVAAWPAEQMISAARSALPMSGRARELTLLVEAFERARESRRVHLATVLGEAGIGKSRLIEELRARIQTEARIMSGSVSEYSEDGTFAPIAEMLRSLIGISSSDSKDHVAKMLHEFVAQQCADPDRVSSRLGLVLGLTADDSENRYEIAEIRSGLLLLLDGLSQSGPVVLIFEDLENARPGLLELIEQMASRATRIPVLIVCAARDWLLKERPSWGGGIAGAITIRLEPLSDASAASLARDAQEDLSEEETARVVRHAGGNPFFIVETACMLAQSKHTHDHDPNEAHWHSHDDPLLPPTVQAVIASRLDHMRQPVRDLIRKASIFPGAAFKVEQLSLIAELDDSLFDELIDSGVLVRDADGFKFRHAMLRDVAYQTLPKRERMRLHLQIAESLKDADRYPSTIAFHLEQAAHASLDLDPTNRSVADRAVDALRHAGDLERRRIQSRGAIERYERGLSLAGPIERWSAREARILAGIGEARYWLGEFAEARAAFERALAVSSDAATRAHAYRFLGDIALNVEGNVSRAEWTLDEAIAAAREHNDPWTIGRTLLIAGWAPYARGDLDECEKMFDEALTVSRSGGDRWAEARALTFIARVRGHYANANDALRSEQQALAIGESIDDPFTIAVAQQAISAELRRLARLDEALAFITKSVDGFTDLGAPWERASAIGDRGNIYRLLGRLEEAETDLREALNLCHSIKERTLAAWTTSELARVLISRASLDEARSLLRHPSISRASDETSSLENTFALAHTGAGDTEGAAKHFAAALRFERDRGWANYIAAQVWVVNAFCGADAAGGDEEVTRAKSHLESSQWNLVLHNPTIALA